jgi:hypothetical protein
MRAQRVPRSKERGAAARAGDANSGAVHNRLREQRRKVLPPSEKKFTVGRPAVVDWGRPRTTNTCCEWFTIQGDGEATMKYYQEKTRDGLFSCETVRTAGKPSEEPATAGLPLAADGPLPNAQDQRTFTDYSEEAIPERDPAYQLPDGTLYETKTVEYMPRAERLALARCLEQLGMSAARAALLASL